jgi:hypothetical protein
VDVIQAIIEHWDDNLSGYFSDDKLWFGEAPSQPTMPYAVLVQVSEPITARSTAFSLKAGVYQINCMADDLDESVELAGHVWTAFDRASLNSSANILHSLSGETRTTLGVGLGLGGSDCWVTYVEVEILSQR